MNEIDNSQKPTPTTVERQEDSGFDIFMLWRIFILNWYWIILGGLLGFGIAHTYLRYVPSVYSATAKILIKQSDSPARSRNAIAAATDLGMMTETDGFSNELEILKSSGLAAEVLKNLKLYTSYQLKGRFGKTTVYKDQPINVDLQSSVLDKLNRPMSIVINRSGGTYNASITYYVPITEFEVEEFPNVNNVKITSFPMTVSTKVGNVTFSKGKMDLSEKMTEYVTIQSPQSAAYSWTSRTTVNPSTKESSVVDVNLSDESSQRAVDYLREMVNCYNSQANDDKNEKALRTEEFIAERLSKITAELDSTDENLRRFLEENRTIAIEASSQKSFSQTTENESKLDEIIMEEELINSLVDFARRKDNKYQVIPSNVGLKDQASTSLINQYNELALERKRLLRTASAKSPLVIEITSQMDDVWKSIDQALDENRKALNIQRAAIEAQLGHSEIGVEQSPEQQKRLKQISRQQEVQSSLYLTLLQKREENQIQLASTADKARLIEPARSVGQIAPKRSMILLIGLGLGLVIPFIFLYLTDTLRYKIDGHDDVVKLTTLPILADVAVANDKAKERGDVVVKRNTNNQMAEIFRGIRTNVQFMMPEGKKRIMLTSSLSGEGKTFIAANLAVSFALLDKKVIMLGLDIRRPRLANLFKLEGVKDTQTGISTLLTLDDPTWKDIEEQIVSSQINENLDILMAGPIPPNPSELLARPSLEKIINQLCEYYDYVIMDTAPIGIVTDTIHIGKLADATIYVTRADYTPKASIEGLNELVDTQKLNNVGIVINGIDMSKKKNAYSYGYGRYGKYGRYGRYGSGKYGKRYGRYGSYGGYGNYGSYGNYQNSRYGNKKDNSVKLRGTLF